MERLSVDISSELRERLVADAARRRIPMGVLVREALDAHLRALPPKPAPAKKPVSPPASTRLPSARATTRWCTPHE